VSTTLGMILRLMHEAGKGSASTFAPYLETMHEGLPDTPIFWSSQELTELDGTAVNATERLSQLLDAYEKHAKPLIALRPSLWPAPHDSRDAFKRATATVTSRGFHATAGGPYMVPVCDMLNHHCTAPSTSMSSVKIQGDVTFRMLLDTPVKAGDQIWNSYGAALPNHELLNGYGFLDATNEERTCVVFPLELILEQCKEDSIQSNPEEAESSADAKKSEVMFKRKKASLQEAGCLPDKAFTVTKDDMVPEQLLTVLQVMHMDEEMFRHFEEEPTILGTELDVEDDEFVEAVERSLLGVVERKLGQYKGTLAEDVELVKTAQGRLCTAIKLRMVEKTMLMDLKAQLLEDATKGLSEAVADSAHAGEKRAAESTAAATPKKKAKKPKVNPAEAKRPVKSGALSSGKGGKAGKGGTGQSKPKPSYQPVML